LLPRGLRPLATGNACRTNQVDALPLSFLHLVQSSVLTTRTQVFTGEPDGLQNGGVGRQDDGQGCTDPSVGRMTRAGRWGWRRDGWGWKPRSELT